MERKEGRGGKRKEGGKITKNKRERTGRKEGRGGGRRRNKERNRRERTRRKVGARGKGE